ncbi:DUF721 domain-containing protein [Streptomyces sp. NPDC056488]|uniref:DUF721 domain-containing protein n=1 Tax=Streptomyces sp. NPDC056488 TaxID=3345836 RepID=UPI00369CD232
MTGAPQPSGIDLARQALIAAREAARKNSGTRQDKPRRRTGQSVRRDGREPLGLGAAISMMMTERGLAAPVAGGSVLARFADIVAEVTPELAGRVRAVAFDVDTGCLDVVPDAPAYGAKLRWSTPRLVAAVNEKVPGVHVRLVNVRPPASGVTGPSPSAADAGGPAVPQPPAAVAGPVKTRETASAGYRRALAAHQATQQTKAQDPAPTAEPTIRPGHARAPGPKDGVAQGSAA